jgi:hypothetical protein
MQKIIRQIAAEIKVQEHQIKTAVELLDGGATVPVYRALPQGGHRRAGRHPAART